MSTIRGVQRLATPVHASMRDLPLLLVKRPSSTRRLWVWRSILMVRVAYEDSTVTRVPLQRPLIQCDRNEPKPTGERNSDVAEAVEMAMTPGHTISIVPTAVHVEVRLGGRLLADTVRAMKLDETGLPARYYLPPDDVHMDLLRPTTFHTTCPFKGEASYWSLDIDGETYDGIVWSYEAPTAQAAEVRGMLSFYPDRTEVTVDGQLLRD
jgi:uncharacterized protein (DUF427 family)